MTERKVRNKWIIISAAYLAISLAVFYPAIIHIRHVAPGSSVSAYLNLWSFWWADYALFNSLPIFKTILLFYPVGVNLSLQPISVLTSVIFGPFGAISNVFAYNMAIVAGFTLSGICMFLLAYRLSKSSYGAFISGIIYAFSAYHIAGAYTNISLIFTAWIPLFIYFMVGFFRNGGKLYDSVGVIVAFALAAFMGDLYQGVLLVAIFICISIAFFLFDRKSFSKRFAVLATAFFVEVILVSAFYMPVFKNPQILGVEEATSAPLLSFFTPGYYNGLLYDFVSSSPIYRSFPEYKSDYIGYIALALALIGTYSTRKSNSTKLLLLLAFFSAWLALGPYITLRGIHYRIGSAFLAYSIIPFFNVLQEPSYFDIILMLSIALLAAVGIEVIESKLSKHQTFMAMLAAILSLAIFTESAGIPVGNFANIMYTQVKPSSIYHTISTLKGNFSVLVLPSIATTSNAKSATFASEATYYTAIMRRPIVGGYSVGENETDLISVYNVPLAIQAASLSNSNAFSYTSPVLQNLTNQTLFSLYNYGTGLIVVNKQAYNATQFGALMAYMASIFGAPVYSDNSTIAFETFKAINESLFKSFVGYAVLSEWMPATLMVNATPVQMWQPTKLSGNDLYGAITVYAPSSNALINASNGNYVEGKIAFFAYSAQKSNVTVGMLLSNRTIRLGSFNLTRGLGHYDLNATFLPGPYGNVLFFIVPSSVPTYICNITFSRLQG